MKSRILLIFTIFTAVLLLSSCIVTSYDFNVEISCDEFGESNHRSGEFEVEVGDKIRVELCSDQTTGFQWDYEMTVENVLREEDHDFEEPEGDVPGAAGTELWTFEAVAAGTTVVQMEYSQPSEGGLKSEWTYNMTVTVE
jgi:inhibitor of cysteine peptidase